MMYNKFIWNIGGGNKEMNVNQATKLIDKLVEEISDELLKENAPRTTGVLQKTPRKVMIQQIMQMQLDALIDEIFDTDDNYMCNQRWKKEYGRQQGNEKQQTHDKKAGTTA